MLGEVFVRNTSIVKKYNVFTDSIALMKIQSPTTLANAIPVVDTPTLTVANAFYTLMEHMIDPNPETRYTITQAKEEYIQFLNLLKETFMPAVQSLARPSPVPSSSNSMDYAMSPYTSNPRQLFRAKRVGSYVRSVYPSPTSDNLNISMAENIALQLIEDNE